MNKKDVELLGKEVELLMNERTLLLKVVGAAAVFVANMEVDKLPEDAMDSADLLSNMINELPEETLKDALDAVKAEIEADEI